MPMSRLLRNELCEYKHEDLTNLMYIYERTREQLRTIRRTAMQNKKGVHDIITTAKDKWGPKQECRTAKDRGRAEIKEKNSVLQLCGRNSTEFGVSFKNGGPEILRREDSIEPLWPQSINNEWYTINM